MQHECNPVSNPAIAGDISLPEMFMFGRRAQTLLLPIFIQRIILKMWSLIYLK